MLFSARKAGRRFFGAAWRERLHAYLGGVIRTVNDQGVTFFDCAEAYGPHENERILGEAAAPFHLEGKRTLARHYISSRQAMRLPYI